MKAFAFETSDLIVDNTILSDVAQCDTKAAMRYVLGLTTREEASVLRAGSAIHEALAWWLCRQGPERAVERFTENYRTWAKENVPADDRLAWKPLRGILKGWLAKNPLDKWHLVVKPEEVEVPLAATLGYVSGTKVVAPDSRQATERSTLGKVDLQRVVMVALLDALGKVRTGGRWSIDHKSTGNAGDYFKRRQEDSSQFTGQLWLAKQRGILLSGIYINALELKKVPDSNRKCDKHSVSGIVVKYAECGQQHLNHRLFPITRTAHEIAAWETTARRLATRFVQLRTRVEDVHAVRELPMNGRFNGACGFCEFRDWCRMGRPAGSVNTFKEERWNPLDHAQRHVDAIAAARA